MPGGDTQHRNSLILIDISFIVIYHNLYLKVYDAGFSFKKKKKKLYRLIQKYCLSIITYDPVEVHGDIFLVLFLLCLGRFWASTVLKKDLVLVSF